MTRSAAAVIHLMNSARTPAHSRSDAVSPTRRDFPLNFALGDGFHGLPLLHLFETIKDVCSIVNKLLIFIEDFSCTNFALFFT